MRRHATCFRALIALTALAFSAVAHAIDPLPDDLLTQARTARDLTPTLDEPALHPLLIDAQTWKPGDITNARIPDFATLQANPAKYRAEPFIIEGLFGGAANRSKLAMPPIGMPGLRDLKPEIWTIITDEAADQVVLVILTNPPEQLPKAGSRVRAVGRLYKVWSYVDVNKKDRSALMFVGRDLSVLDTASAVKTSNSNVIALTVLVFVGVGILLFGVRYLRNRGAAAPAGDFRDRLRKIAGDEAQAASSDRDGADEPEPPLPSDPVEALKELQRRADKAEQDGKRS